jgi:hypothetical protein
VPENVARPPGPYPAIEEGALGAPDSEDLCGNQALCRVHATILH